MNTSSFVMCYLFSHSPAQGTLEKAGPSARPVYFRNPANISMMKLCGLGTNCGYSARARPLIHQMKARGAKSKHESIVMIDCLCAANFLVCNLVEGLGRHLGTKAALSLYLGVSSHSSLWKRAYSVHISGSALIGSS